MATVWLGLAGTFICGALPFGYWLGKLRGVDLKATGSGNIGATNTARSLGWIAGILVLVLDAAKAALPTAGMLWLTASPNWAALAGVFAMLGHVFSPFVGFKGGKGVACALGALLVLQPWVALGAVAGFVVIAWAWRWVSLASVAAAQGVPLVMMLAQCEPALVGFAYAQAALILWTHRQNLRRIQAGTEPRLGSGRGAED